MASSTHYVSEYTTFMNEWMKKHPEELVAQQSGRQLWWDRGAQELDAQARLAAAKVPQKPYYYDAN
ncbi:MAG: DUF3460 family protein [Rhodocyclaceae bacterium]|nr:DUF3460 family protein [Rhodocyclaceae bacterium]MDP3032493.1 DUF3460 family protein [Rhodocyclaceae bacterium]